MAFPECFVPGYRLPGRPLPPPDAAFLERAWSTIARCAAAHRVGVVLGTEGVVGPELLASALVIGPDGTQLGFQDKVQIDPSEEGTYTPGTDRTLISIGPLTSAS